MKYMIDDTITEEYSSTLAEANKIATRMKREHPLRAVYVGKFTDGANGEEYEVVAEA